MYDTIVIGNDLSALVAALVSARRGLKTALMTEGATEDALSEGGYTFNVDPFPWSGFGSSQIFHRLLQELNHPPSRFAHIVPVNPGLQIVMREHRLDLFIDENDFLRDLDREFPGQSENVRKLFQKAAKADAGLEKILAGYRRQDPVSLREAIRDRANRMLSALGAEILFSSRYSRTLPKHSPWGAAFEAQCFALSHIIPANGVPMVSARLLLQPLKGLFYHAGGKYVLLRSLRERLQSLGGDLLEGCDPDRVVTGEMVEVFHRSGTREGVAVGKRLVVSDKWRKLGTLLAGDRRFAGTARKFGSIEQRRFPLTLHLGVDGGGVPEKMSEYVIVLTGESSLPSEERVVFLEVSADIDREMAPAGKRSISATAFVDSSPLEMTDGALREAFKGILGRLSCFLPFLEEHIEVINVEASIRVSRMYQSVVSPRYRFRKPIPLGVFGISQRTPAGNVFISGGSTLPGLGFEGEVLSGIRAGTLAAGGGNP